MKNPLNSICTAKMGAAKLIAVFTSEAKIEIKWPTSHNKKLILSTAYKDTLIKKQHTQ